MDAGNEMRRRSEMEGDEGWRWEEKNEGEAGDGERRRKRRLEMRPSKRDCQKEQREMGLPKRKDK